MFQIEGPKWSIVIGVRSKRRRRRRIWFGIWFDYYAKAFHFHLALFFVVHTLVRFGWLISFFLSFGYLNWRSKLTNTLIDRDRLNCPKPFSLIGLESGNNLINNLKHLLPFGTHLCHLIIYNCKHVPCRMKWERGREWKIRRGSPLGHM